MFRYIVFALGLVNCYVSINGGGNVAVPKTKYKPDPQNDLYRITHSQASTISKSWVEILTSSVPAASLIGNGDTNYKKYRVDSYSHLYHGINDFERYLNNHRTDKDLYLSWQPMKLKQKIPETLFIVAAEIDPVTKTFKIQHLLESPTWLGSVDISTLELKKALETVNSKANCTTIDYSPLKDTGLRFYWSWFPREVVCK